MRNPARGDVWTVWLYAGAVVTLGAWAAPLLYNAGKALAEVSARKTTNAPLEGLAGICQKAEFPRFYEAALVLAAVILLVPWLEWLHARRGKTTVGDTRPLLLRLLDGWRLPSQGQPLRKNPHGLWHGGAGFLLVAGLLLALNMALVAASRRIAVPVPPALAESLALAIVLEVLFGGLALGIFLQAMRPAAALGMSAMFFALVLCAWPLPGENVADPEAAGTGFEMLRLAVWRFADWRGICGHFAPLLALGGLLAYARWRTASLWLPCGMLAGWLFARAMTCIPATSTVSPGGHHPALSGTLLQQGVISLAALFVAGVLTHFLTVHPHADAPRT